MHKFPRLFKLSAILLTVVFLATFSIYAIAAPDASGPGVPPPPDDPPPSEGSDSVLSNYFFVPWSIFLPVGY